MTDNEESLIEHTFMMCGIRYEYTIDYRPSFVISVIDKHPHNFLPREISIYDGTICDYYSSVYGITGIKLLKLDINTKSYIIHWGLYCNFFNSISHVFIRKSIDSYNISVLSDDMWYKVLHIKTYYCAIDCGMYKW